MSINLVSASVPQSSVASGVSKTTAKATTTATASAQSAPSTAESKPQASAAAVKTVSAAVQEASESPGQTLKEAAAGDRQAQKLLHHGANPGSVINTKA